ncbi:tRNA (adenosine(37)-N6)-threonylcarbamoyltransferase complex transferase subunit TsaD [Candidatus Woesearchaeota archaeon]|nr:tRNA (adenosine(37)-N6)-threonylcarbamoyltransferase complex transferase subunit TsaD [Candidatus Woesearchaeota archaeon]
MHFDSRDTFGVGIVTDGKKILANVKDSYTTEQGGIIPSKAMEHHVSCFDFVISSALKKAKISIHDIDLIAFSQGPGIGHTLRVGCMAARTISSVAKKPLIGVNHCISHLEIGSMLTASKNPVLLYVSGANTQIISYEKGRYRILGESLDGGLGNFLDTLARELGFGFPGGPKIAELAENGRNLIELPYVIKGMDISLGGILTNAKLKIKSGKYSKEDICYSVQETVFAMLVEAAERAMSHTGKNELLLGGGVACNKRLRNMCTSMCKQRKAKCYCPENEFCVDNGVQIAWLGILMNKAGMVTKLNDAVMRPYERVDDIEVQWKPK